MENKDTVTALEYIRNSASMRAALQNDAKVGLNALGTYVCDVLSVDAIKASVAAVSEGAGKIKWAEGTKALISSGKNGTVVRFGRLSECGLYVDAKGQAGGRGIVSVMIYGEKGKLTIEDEATFAKRLQSCALHAFTRKHDESKYEGFLVGSLADKLASIVYSLKGALVSVDTETRKNEYNEKAIGGLGGKNEAMKERTQATVERLASGAVAEKKVKTVKAKMAKKKAATLEAVETVASEEIAG